MVCFQILEWVTLSPSAGQIEQYLTIQHAYNKVLQFVFNQNEMPNSLFDVILNIGGKKKENVKLLNLM